MKVQSIFTRSGLCLLGLLGLTLFVSPIAAQVFDSGPSDSALFDNVINIPSDPDIDNSSSIGGSGLTTQLNIFDGGSVGGGVEAISGTEVNVSGGSLSFFFDAESGSEINISGGDVGSGLDANSGSEVNISGGSIGNGFNANSGSEVNISGGCFDRLFEAFSGSQVNISGGSFEPPFRANSGSDVELIGGEFRLNGAAFSGSTITLNADDVFTGTLADGSAFVFNSQESRSIRFPFDTLDTLSGVQLTQVALPSLDLSPIVISNPNPNLPPGLRPGQTLTLQDGGEANNFAVVGATLNVEGGSFSACVEATESTINISGSGGIGNFSAYFGSQVNISGNGVGVFSEAFSGSEVNISGGFVGLGFVANSGSVVNFSGGMVGAGFGAFSGSQVNVFGSDFVLDGIPLDDRLTINNAFTILDRDVTLSGLLADGTEFSFVLNSVFTNANPGGTFEPGATLTVTLVASKGLLGDVNLDGVVDFFDIAPFIAILADQMFQFEADIDGDQDVDFFDIAPFIEILAGQG